MPAAERTGTGTRSRGVYFIINMADDIVEMFLPVTNLLKRYVMMASRRENAIHINGPLLEKYLSAELQLSTSYMYMLWCNEF